MLTTRPPRIYKTIILPVWLHGVETWSLTLREECDDIRTIERNADVLLNSCKDIRLAVNTGKTKYMEIGFIEA